MDAAGVARAVVVPPSWEGDRNDFAREAARSIRFAIMGGFAIERPEDGAIEDSKRQPGMMGRGLGAWLGRPLSDGVQNGVVQAVQSRT